MSRRGYRYESEIHLGLLGIICLLLLVNLVSNYVSYSARSVEREKGGTRLQGIAVAISRQLEVGQIAALSGPAKLRLLREHNLTDLALLAPRPEPFTSKNRRQWLVSIAHDLPVSRLGEVADALMQGETQRVQHIEGDQFMYTYPVREGNGERLLVLAAEMPELASLERGARLVFAAGVIASVLVLAIYLLLARRIFWPLRKIRKAAVDAGLSGTLDDTAESVVEEYERIIAELRHKETELRQANSVITEMSAGMAHQLRNSLGAISGFGALIKRQLHKRGDDTVSADALLDETHEAKELITRFLDISRPLRPERQVVPLPAFIGEVITAAEANRTLDPQTWGTGPIPECEANLDPLLVKQALLNLIDNAFKAYGTRGGRIYLRVNIEGRDLSLSIEDRAGGISPEIRDKLFTPFVSSRPSGTGLGLAFVNRVVIAHGGAIEVDSVPGEGSRFVLHFPEAVVAQMTSGTVVPTRQKSLSI